MEKKLLIAPLWLAFQAAALPLLSSPLGRTIDPVVSTSWLETNLNTQNLVVVDIRSPEEYAQGHIAKAINQPFPTWWVVRDGLLLELPEPADLLRLVGNLGISQTSQVVIVNKSIDDYSRADPGRVAWTLAYAGIKNFAILDGGITKWASENKALITTPVTATPVTYTGPVKPGVVVSKAHVSQKLEDSTVDIVDARLPEDYFSVTPLVLTDRPGHITGAKCLPTPWMFTAQGIFKPVDTLKAMAKGVLGKTTNSEEVITYCGVGGYGAAMWFVLSEILQYPNVKMYDGSIQEWSKDANAPMNLYKWK